jgi:hypothetical protein
MFSACTPPDWAAIHGPVRPGNPGQNRKLLDYNAGPSRALTTAMGKIKIGRED